jgi:hypothetical protein
MPCQENMSATKVCQSWLRATSRNYLLKNYQSPRKNMNVFLEDIGDWHQHRIQRYVLVVEQAVLLESPKRTLWELSPLADNQQQSKALRVALGDLSCFAMICQPEASSKNKELHLNRPPSFTLRLAIDHWPSYLWENPQSRRLSSMFNRRQYHHL